MSRPIRITDAFRKKVIHEFSTELNNISIADGKINFIKSFCSTERKAVVCFTELAWLKMQSLIMMFDKEVAWHGIAKRGTDESKDEYYITDIMVYPQTVTGATVNTDQEKYQTWLMMHDDDVFNNIRMQGHSHVNMGTSPSSVDTTHQEQIIAQLEDDMFYIFMIWNKRNEKTIKIYDMKKNVLFDSSDITITVQDNEMGIQLFLDEAKRLVQDKNTISSVLTANYAGSTDIHSNNKKLDQKENIAKQTQPTHSGGSGKKKRKGKRKGSGAPNDAWNGYDCRNLGSPHNASGYRERLY